MISARLIICAYILRIVKRKKKYSASESMMSPPEAGRWSYANCTGITATGDSHLSEGASHRTETNDVTDITVVIIRKQEIMMRRKV